MNSRLHNYLDRIIKAIIDCDIPHTLDEIELNSFNQINAEIYKDNYFGKDLICIGIYGVDSFDYENTLETIVIRTKDVKNEFNNNIQSVIDYIQKPLNDYNNKLQEETI